MSARNIFIKLTLIACFGLIPHLSAREAYLQDEPDSIKVEPSGEIKIFSDLLIPENEVRAGNLRVIGGDLTVDGKVTGRITVLGGDVTIGPSAQIEGGIFAIGGKINRHPDARVTGEVVEVNTSRVSFSREKDEDFLAFDEDEDERLERLDDEFDREDIDYRVPGRFVWQYRPGRKDRSDFEIPSHFTFRYNRSEGAALYIPFSPDTDDIPGFRIHSYVGRAFGPKRWYGKLAIGQYLWDYRILFYAEGHREPRHNDVWRISPLENTLGAMFLHKDWHDWYETEGAGGAIVFRGPYATLLRVGYRNEEHRAIDYVADWSLFGKDRDFRVPYAIAPGKDVNLSWSVSVGRPTRTFHRRLALYGAYTQAQTMAGSDFGYTSQDVRGELFLPYQRRLGLRLRARTGVVTASEGGYGLQHLTPLGGIGSVAGYGYKSFTVGGENQYGNHYGLIQAAFTYRTRGDDFVALEWHFGNNWASDEGLYYGDYVKDLQSHSRHSIGLSLGDDEHAIQMFKPLSTGYENDWIFYLRIIR